MKFPWVVTDVNLQVTEAKVTVAGTKLGEPWNGRFREG